MPSPTLRLRALMSAGALSAAMAVAIALPAASPVAAAAHTVQITDSTFGPGVLTIQVGDTVTWTNADDRPHTVTSNDGAFDSGNLDEGATFSFTFDATGTYAYLCEYHPEMTATIVVEAAAAQAPTPPASTAPAGGTAEQPSHDASHAAGDDQPDTAIAAPGLHVPAASYLLWGSALILLAFGFVPRVTRQVRAVSRPPGGWRR